MRSVNFASCKKAMSTLSDFKALHDDSRPPFLPHLMFHEPTVNPPPPVVPLPSVLDGASCDALMMLISVVSPVGKTVEIAICRPQTLPALRKSTDRTATAYPTL
jgi:hypothetical protein